MNYYKSLALFAGGVLFGSRALSAVQQRREEGLYPHHGGCAADEGLCDGDCHHSTGECG